MTCSPLPQATTLNYCPEIGVHYIQHIKVGGKSKLVCPSSLGYRDKGLPPLIKPGATLVFEIELLEIIANQVVPH
ncbi:MAG: FKBP-type peptidyl-prolyl cis-trans isomerase [Nitrospira sp.]